MARNADGRGYVGGERNRTLDPLEVLWARSAYQRRELTAGDIAQRFGIGVESARRMLRGDTYANVGEAVAREELGKSRDDGGMIDRLVAHQRAVEERTPTAPAPTSTEPPAGEEAINLFLDGGKK